LPPSAMPNKLKTLLLAEEEMWRGFLTIGWEAALTDFVRKERTGLLSGAALLLTEKNLSDLREFVLHIEAAFADPAYIGASKKTHPGLIGYDLHLGEDGPKLIEVNTNPGGLLLNLAHAEVALSLLPELALARSGDLELKEISAEILAAFQAEWQGRAPINPTIAIIDKNPSEQYLWPEFQLYRQFFAQAGIQALIADPTELTIEGQALCCRGQKIDVVYNRLTDFSLREPENSVLAEAWRQGLALLVPDPPAHELYADKLNLIRLSQREEMRPYLPQTLPLAPELWAERRRFFFKPRDGFAGRGAYRGDKLSKGKWAEILSGDYVAQEYAPPPLCRLALLGEFKFDIRLYARKGRILIAAARLYNGQTTNFRTPYGGFAPVFFAL
jgi:hypothetical protein